MSFPEQLGPFGVVPTNFQRKHFWTGDPRDDHDSGISPNSHAYLIGRRAFESEPLKLLEAHAQEFPLHGQLSPSHVVTLDDASKIEANIPVKSTSFCWSYPVAGLNSDASEHADLTDPDTCFLVIGGYVYFDKKGKFLAANALFPQVDMSSGGLYFSPKQQWDPLYTDYLYKRGRFQQITIKALNDLGAHYFCWILPNEELVSVTGERRKFCPNGGFVYLFHKDPYSEDFDKLLLDRFFYVVGQEEFHRRNSMLEGVEDEEVDDDEYFDERNEERTISAEASSVPRPSTEPSAPHVDAQRNFFEAPQFPHLVIPRANQQDDEQENPPPYDAPDYGEAPPPYDEQNKENQNSQPTHRRSSSVKDRIKMFQHLGDSDSHPQKSQHQHHKNRKPFHSSGSGSDHDNKQRKSISDRIQALHSAPEEKHEHPPERTRVQHSHGKVRNIKGNQQFTSQIIAALASGNQLKNKGPPKSKASGGGGGGGDRRSIPSSANKDIHQEPNASADDERSHPKLKHLQEDRPPAPRRRRKPKKRKVQKYW